MSAIGGIFSRSGRPWDPRALEVLGEELSIIGPDGTFTGRSGPVGMVFCAFHTDAESRRAAQPLVTPDGFLLAWNGRLDNREEIEAALSAPSGQTEPELALAAWRSWDVDAFRRMVGDFALALWDPRQRKLVLATDALNVRHIYYHASRDFLVWATRARPLLALSGLSPEPDEEYVAGFLVRHRFFDRSPFRGISRLEAAHALIVGPEELRTRRYWSPDPGLEIRYRTDAEYEDHYREIFGRAVSCRLRSEGPVFCELSGGLDSSSIACIAGEALARGGSGAPEMRTVSYVYDRCTLSDEREFISRVESHLGQRGLHIREDDFPLLVPPPETFRPDQPNGQLMYLTQHRELAARMAESQGRVLLRGFGGDEVTLSSVSPGPLELADLLVRGRLADLFHRCGLWSQKTAMPWGRTFWRGGVWPLLPRKVQAALGPYKGEGFFRKHAELAAPGFQGVVDLDSRILGHGFQGGLPRPSQRHQCAAIFEMAHFVVPDLMLDEGCVEIRYPFYDRRLIEFILAIPMDQKLRPGETRSLARRALRGVLPDEVRERRTKGGPEEAFHRAILREWSWISQKLRDSFVARYGFIDREAFARTLWQARHGINTGPLLRVFCLEFWLGSLAREGRGRPEVNPLHSVQHNLGEQQHEELRDARSVRVG